MNRELVNQLFEELRHMTPPSRAAHLARQSAIDEPTLREVKSLLAFHDQVGGFLGGPAADPTSPLPDPAPDAHRGADDPLIGALIGPYKLLELIGEGGFGSVYMAEQLEPIRRRVAFKILKPGMDSKRIIARFEAERQALALMDHPNIAKVLDAGTTPAARGSLPYFVMELVRGTSITRYCDEARLSPRERLDILVPVCRAVQHAHQKGVIHRDIKPSNVLVTLHDGVPVPKLLDFGIAKATGVPLTDRTMFTEFRQLIGTPAYMSPEQAEMSGLDIDTRSDIYSLGVLMYELLTGSTPFDSAALLTAGLAEMQRIIRESVPPRPSTRVTTDKEQLRTVAAARRTPPERLGAIVRGELDWIVMRAIEKDRRRRYDTAADLAADIERHLAGRPVQAAPPSRVYLARKFLARNRLPAVAAGAILLATLIGVLGISAGLMRARASAAEALLAAGSASLIAANSALFNGDGIAARSFLARVPEETRGWEWDMLWAATDQSTAVIRPDRPAGALVLNERVEVCFTISGVPPNIANIRAAAAPTDDDVSLDMFDLASGTRLVGFRAREFAVAPDGRSFIARENDGAYVRRTLDDGRELWRVRIGEGGVTGPTLSPDQAFSPDGASWFVKGTDAARQPRTEQRSAADGSLLAAWPGASVAVPTAVLTPNLRVVMPERMIDVAANQISPMQGDASNFKTGRFGRRNIWANAAHLLVDDVLGRSIRIPSSAGTVFRAADVDPSFTRVAAILDGGRLRAWGVRDGLLVDAFGAVAVPEDPFEIRFTHDGARIVLHNRDGSMFRVLPGVPSNVAQRSGADTRHGAAYHRGRVFMLGWGDMMACDAESLEPLWRINLGPGIGRSTSVSGDGSAVAAVLHNDSDPATNELHVVNAATGTVRWSLGLSPVRLPASGEPQTVPSDTLLRSVAFDAEGRRLLVTTAGAEAHVFDASIGTLTDTIVLPVSNVSLLSSPDKSMIATFNRMIGDTDNRLIVLDGRSFVPIASWPLATPPVRVAWSDDSRWLVAGMRDGSLARFNIGDSAPVWTVRTSIDPRWMSPAVLRKHNRVLVSGQGGLLLAIEAETGRVIAELKTVIRSDLLFELAEDGHDMVAVGVYGPVDRIETVPVLGDQKRQARLLSRAAWNVMDSIGEMAVNTIGADAAGMLIQDRTMPPTIAEQAARFLSVLGPSINWSNSEVVRWNQHETPPTPEESAKVIALARQNAGLKPHSASLQGNLGVALQRAGMHDEAVAAFDRGISIATERRLNEPLLLRYRAGRVVSLARTQRREEARSEIEAIRARAEELKLADPQIDKDLTAAEAAARATTDLRQESAP